MAKSASGLSFGPTNGDKPKPNEKKISAILIAKIIREYGEARPVSGSVRIISTMKVEARHDINALMHLMICAAFRLELMVCSAIRVSTM